MMQKNNFLNTNIKSGHSRVSLSGIFDARRCSYEIGKTLLHKRPLRGRSRTKTFRDDGLCFYERQTACGFTLIELLVVVLIIGILAAVALPQYQFAIDKSRVSSYLPKIADLTKAQQAYLLANGTYTHIVADLDIDFTNLCPYQWGMNELVYCPGNTALHTGGSYVDLDYCSSLECSFSDNGKNNKILRATFSMQTGKLTACNDFSTARGKKLCAWLTDQFQ